MTNHNHQLRKRRMRRTVYNVHKKSNRDKDEHDFDETHNVGKQKHVVVGIRSSSTASSSNMTKKKKKDFNTGKERMIALSTNNHVKRGKENVHQPLLDATIANVHHYGHEGSNHHHHHVKEKKNLAVTRRKGLSTHVHTHAHTNATSYNINLPHQDERKGPISVNSYFTPPTRTTTTTTTVVVSPLSLSSTNRAQNKRKNNMNTSLSSSTNTTRTNIRKKLPIHGKKSILKINSKERPKQQSPTSSSSSSNSVSPSWLRSKFIIQKSSPPKIRHFNVITLKKSKNNDNNNQERRNNTFTCKDPLAEIIEARKVQVSKVRFDLSKNRVYTTLDKKPTTSSLSGFRSNSSGHGSGSDISSSSCTVSSSLSSPGVRFSSSASTISSSSCASSSLSSISSYGTMRSTANMTDFSDSDNVEGGNDINTENPTNNTSQIKGFMRRILFNHRDSDNKQSSSSSLSSSSSQISALLANEQIPPLSPSILTSRESSNKNSSTNLKSKINTNQKDDDETSNFLIDPSITNSIIDIIHKGKRAQYTTYQYNKASKHYLNAISKLDQHAYPPNHKLRQITMVLLNDTHHAMRSLEHSSDIVKMGIKHEEKGEYVKALKMYTVAFRIRRDAMGKNHPSLPVLLNLLGSVQLRRGELDEAMQIFELALYGRLKNDNMRVVGKTNVGNATKVVSMREMGQIYALQGKVEEALEMYHDSLECVLLTMTTQSKYNMKEGSSEEEPKEGCSDQFFNDSQASPSTVSMAKSIPRSRRLDNYRGSNTLLAQCNVCQATSTSSPTNNDGRNKEIDVTTHIKPNSSNNPSPPISENEEMEVYLEDQSYSKGKRNPSNLVAFYNSFFKDHQLITSKNISVQVAMTLHNIANIHRKGKSYKLSISSYEAALRGMKIALGENHSNIAAILGNIGNVYKDMKNFDLAYNLYQDVLKIESRNLGDTHPEVIVTMHNIAMIEKCRGNFDDSKQLYRKVLSIQNRRKEPTLKWCNAVAVSYSCLGDVEEKDGNYQGAIEAYKEALTVRSHYGDKFHPDLGSLLHKIGVLNAHHGSLRDATIYFAKALKLYEFNNIEDSRRTIVLRDQADVLGKIAFNSSTI